MDRIVLATKSPFRIEGFAELGFSFESREADIDEKFLGRPKNPSDLVLELAKRKANNVAMHYESGLTIGCDSVAYLDKKILEKPISRNEAFQRLKKLLMP